MNVLNILSTILYVNTSINNYSNAWYFGNIKGKGSTLNNLPILCTGSPFMHLIETYQGKTSVPTKGSRCTNFNNGFPRFVLSGMLMSDWRWSSLSDGKRNNNSITDYLVSITKIWREDDDDTVFIFWEEQLQYPVTAKSATGSNGKKVKPKLTNGNYNDIFCTETGTAFTASHALYHMFWKLWENTDFGQKSETVTAHGSMAGW